MAPSLRALLLSLFGAGLASVPVCAAEETGPQAAEWMTREIIVVLEDLPRHYTCDELWRKFHDVLLELGARPQMQVLPYRCESPDSRSPRVQLRFDILKPLDPLLLPYAEVKAVTETVRLEPGHPQSLEPSDCVLLEQIQDTLLRSLQLQAQCPLACRGGKANGDFSLVTEALLPQSPPGEDAPPKQAQTSG